MQVGEVYVFHLHDAPERLRIVSRSAVPAELGLARDPRSLGIALRQLIIRQGARFQVVDQTILGCRRVFMLSNPITVSAGLMVMRQCLRRCSTASLARWSACYR